MSTDHQLLLFPDANLPDPDSFLPECVRPFAFMPSYVTESPTRSFDFPADKYLDSNLDAVNAELRALVYVLE